MLVEVQLHQYYLNGNVQNADRGAELSTEMYKMLL